MLIRRPCSVKKSAPKIGRLTVAIQNSWSKLTPGLKEILRDRLPNVLIYIPFAATRLVVWWQLNSVEVAGKTHSSAPESTRKSRPEMWSRTEMVPCKLPAAAIDDRRARFPPKERRTREVP